MLICDFIIVFIVSKSNFVPDEHFRSSKLISGGWQKHYSQSYIFVNAGLLTFYLQLNLALNVCNINSYLCIKYTHPNVRGYLSEVIFCTPVKINAH